MKANNLLPVLDDIVSPTVTQISEILSTVMRELVPEKAIGQKLSPLMTEI